MLVDLKRTANIFRDEHQAVSFLTEVHKQKVVEKEAELAVMSQKYAAEVYDLRHVFEQEERASESRRSQQARSEATCREVEPSPTLPASGSHSSNLFVTTSSATRFAIRRRRI